MARIKIKEGEQLSKQNISSVIAALSSDTPITKKEACARLHISYNTTRLNKIIDEFYAQIEYAKTRRKKLRGTPITLEECGRIVSSYLNEEPLSGISDSTFRSVDSIKRVLLKYNVPLRSEVGGNNNLIPDDGISEQYEKGDLVYVSRYGTTGVIDKFIGTSGGFNAYRIWLTGLHRRSVNQPFYELSDLTAVQAELGITIYEMDNTDVQGILRETLRRINSRSK